jgi:tripartite-type tricarboxylate transporter receptor subunit TctC
MRKIKVLLSGITALACIVGLAGFSWAAFPDKPINYIICFNPGGQSDVTARLQQKDLEKALGVSVVVQYRVGAGGAVGWADLVRSKPDGYTIAGNNIPHIILQPLMRKDAGYQTDQLVEIYMFETTPIGLAVRKDSPYKNMKEFLDFAKKNPGVITVAGVGTYTGHHITYLQFTDLTGVKLTYIPFTGAAPQVAAFLGGNAAAIFANSNDLVQHKDKIRVLAMGTEKRFKPYFPDVPTFKELGINMTAGISRGVCAPPGTPPDRIAVLEKAFDKICRSKNFVSKMEQMGFEVNNLNAAQYTKYVAEKKKEYTDLLRKLKMIK